MSEKSNTWGGLRKGSGRKPKEHSDAKKPVTIKLSDEQLKKLRLLGGAPWVREKIDKAKLPTE